MGMNTGIDEIHFLIGYAAFFFEKFLKMFLTISPLKQIKSNQIIDMPRKPQVRVCCVVRECVSA
jgi:hypothetical protein